MKPHFKFKLLMYCLWISSFFFQIDHRFSVGSGQLSSQKHGFYVFANLVERCHFNPKNNKNGICFLQILLKDAILIGYTFARAANKFFFTICIYLLEFIILSMGTRWPHALNRQTTPKYFLLDISQSG